MAIVHDGAILSTSINTSKSSLMANVHDGTILRTSIDISKSSLRVLVHDGTIHYAMYIWLMQLYLL